ncbi:GP80 [Caviid betaherpesvirus 2]|uniref:Capsid scaffolding protein n=2 Tax=Guinea pig cytomegalovirus (strain 22122) TaxID=103920 RepID=B7TPY6_GPCMV|nr:GP80 [Caviid betaherpesvirus 2]AGE11550.1 GP80 [Caviid betaherpesvirus 2]AIL83938.1 GP80 [BAC cloning vector GPN13BACdenovo_preserved(MM)]BAJ78538.1 GP80 [Caviid betaherpesvirus 2]
METDRVFVSGFLALYGEQPQEDCLRLSRDVVAANLPGVDPSSIAININHDDNAVVGRLHGLFDLPNGLFCFGEISSPSFLDIVRRSAEKSQLVSRGPGNGLKPDAVVEYLSTGYPGLSLSSRSTDERRCDAPSGPARAHIDGETTDEGTFFRHVAICGVGRRRGTLAIYGRDPGWMLDRFPGISNEDKLRMVTRVVSAVFAPGARTGADARDPFRSDPYGLLANSVDTSYIRERFPKLDYDKRVLRIPPDTYVKASESPTASRAEGDCIIKRSEPFLVWERRAEESGPSCGAAETDMSAQPQVVPTVVPAASAPAVPAAAVVSASPAPLALSSDCVYLPKDTFLSLVNASRREATFPDVGRPKDADGAAALTSLPSFVAQTAPVQRFVLPESVTSTTRLQPAPYGYAGMEGGLGRPSQIASFQTPYDTSQYGGPAGSGYFGPLPGPSPQVLAPISQASPASQVHPAVVPHHVPSAAPPYQFPSAVPAAAPGTLHPGGTYPQFYPQPTYYGHRGYYGASPPPPPPLAGERYGPYDPRWPADATDPYSRYPRDPVASREREHVGRKRRAEADDGDDQQVAREDLSLPGDADYPRSKRPAVEARDVRQSGRAREDPEYAELRNVIHDLRRDIAVIRSLSGSRSDANGSPAPVQSSSSPSSAPPTVGDEEDASVPSAATTGVPAVIPTAHGLPVTTAPSAPAQPTDVARKAGKAGLPVSGGQHHAHQPVRAKPPLVVNASCVPEAQPGTSRDAQMSILDINRQRFVDALRKME